MEKTDKFGRHIPTIEEKAIKLRLGKEKKTPRILLWSRRGQDRPCFVACAYMIKQYGMSMQKAMGMVEMARAGTLICKYYKKALEEWSRRYTKGEMLCLDCLNSAKEVTSHLTHNERLLDSTLLDDDDTRMRKRRKGNDGLFHV